MDAEDMAKSFSLGSGGKHDQALQLEVQLSPIFGSSARISTLPEQGVEPLRQVLRSILLDRSSGWCCCAEKLQTTSASSIDEAWSCKPLAPAGHVR
jgi:hypothetical protein